MARIGDPDDPDAHMSFNGASTSMNRSECYSKILNYIFPLKTVRSIYNILPVDKSTTPTAAVPIDTIIIFVDIYSVLEYRSNALAIYRPDIISSTIPGNA